MKLWADPIKIAAGIARPDSGLKASLTDSPIYYPAEALLFVRPNAEKSKWQAV